MTDIPSNERVALLERIARLATELCVSVDKAAEDIGGERPPMEILRDIGPLTDQLEKLGPEPAAGVGVIDLAGSPSHETNPEPISEAVMQEFLTYLKGDVEELRNVPVWSLADSWGGFKRRRAQNEAPRDTGAECNGNCFQVGGPFVAEDPECPEHGSGLKTNPKPVDEIAGDRDTSWDKP